MIRYAVQRYPGTGSFFSNEGEILAEYPGDLEAAAEDLARRRVAGEERIRVMRVEEDGTVLHPYRADTPLINQVVTRVYTEAGLIRRAS